MNLAPRWFLVIALGSGACTGPGRADEKSPPPQRIVFGSCARQDRPQPIWGPILAAQPDLFLFIGDNIYADTQDMTVMKEKYARLAAVPGYQKLLKSCPLLATWDDHDYGANDAGADYPKKVEAQQIFLDFFNVPPDSPRRRQIGIYDAHLFGPPEKSVQVILLDTRYFRGPLKKRAKFIPAEGPYDPNPDPAVTLLGEEQWKWLEGQLRRPAKVRLLVSSIQVIAQDHHHEKWFNLPHQRDRLFQLFKDTKAAGLVILSGDRHLAELSMMDAGLGYPLYDFTSSGLNQGFLKWRKLETNRHRVATMNQGHNFGMIAIDWEKADPLLSLQIRDEEGDVAFQQKLKLSTLQPGAFKSKASSRVRLADGTILTEEEAKRRLGQEVTIVMEVKGTGLSASGGLVFLNSSTDRGDDNFTLVLDKKAQAQLKAAGVPIPRTHYEGKSIQATGTLSMFRDRPQMVVSDPRRIKIEGK